MHQEKANQVGSVGRSSAGGSSTGGGGVLNQRGNSSKYQDETKIFSAIKLYTTLDDSDDEDGGWSSSNAQTVIGDGDTSNSKSGRDGMNLNAFLRIEKALSNRLFQINHVLLSNQAVSVLIYHLILVISFLQIVFNIFYQVEILNEFSGSDQMTKVTSVPLSVLQNVTYSNNGTYASNSSYNSSGSSIQSSFSTFRIDKELAFTNFHYYVMFGSSINQFLMLYCILNAIFVLFLFLLFATSGKIFQESKSEDNKEGTKIIILVLSVLMTLFVTVLQIPMTGLLLQGFICNETNATELLTTSAQCGSLQSQLLIIFSAVLLIVYLVFLVIETILFSSNSFDVPVPWASFERRLALMKILIQFVLSIGFVFDKSGNYRGQINLVCFALQAFIVIKRNQDAIIFDSSVFYSTILSETLKLWLYLIVAIHILSGAQLSITSLVLVVACGSIFAGALIFNQARRKQQMVLEDHIDTYSDPIQFIVYFFRLHRLIAEQSSTSDVFLQGKLRQHLFYCDNQRCPCLSVIEFFDSHDSQLKIITQWKEEELLISQYNNNASMANTMANITSIDTKLTIMNQSTALITVQDEEASETISNNNMLGIPQKLQSTQKSFRETGNKGKNTLKGDISATEANGFSTLMIQKRKRVQFEENINRILESPHDQDKVTFCCYELFALFLKDAIDRFPKNVDLKIINAYIQKSKLNNEFKAIFEMMNCELCNPTYQEKFEIFRKKIEVEQALVKQQEKNIQTIGVVDVVQVFQYEKLFQRYQLYEYMTTYAALCFWRELLQKQINASVLQEKGSHISRYYEQIQDVAKKLQAIYPNEIKFFFRYGNFLYQIIHNEYDALENFRLAQNIFQMKMTKKGNSMPVNQQTIFGENSAAAIIVISATSTNIGTIIHCNEEVEEILNYKSKELIGRNIQIITPRPIAKVHDRLIQRYFETAKPRVVEVQRDLLGVSKEGYLQEVDLIVKVFPQVNEKIVFVGFIQRSLGFHDMEPPAAEYERLEKHYIISDVDGNITNVTEGLFNELGLHAKFFHYTDSIFQQMFNLKSICPQILENNIQDSLENEGKVLTIDTTSILSNIELESLTSDEIIEVRSNLGVHDAYIQLKKLEISTYCNINIYRVIMNSNQSTDLALQTSKDKLGSSPIGGDSSEVYDEVGEYSQDAHGAELMSGQVSVSASMSSTTSASFSFNKVIKDFKKALGERKTPRHLTILNRVMIGILLTTLALSSFNFSSLKTEAGMIQNENQQNLMLETRDLKTIQLSSNLVSLINIANGLEFDRYVGSPLLPFDRFEYLSSLIQTQANDLQTIQEYLTEQRDEVETKTGEAVTSQSSFEYQNINLFRLDDQNQVSNYGQPFRVAFIQFLNYIQSLNNTDRSQIVLPFQLISQAPILDSSNFSISQNTTAVQKVVYFLMANGLRSLRTMTRNATLQFQGNYDETEDHNVVLIIMILGILITASSFAVVLYQVWMIDQNKAEILSLYALLQMNEINQVYDACSEYMDILNQGSIISQVYKSTELEELSGAQLGGQDPANLTCGPSVKNLALNGYTNIIELNEKNANDRKRWSQMSEDEKEEIEQKELLQHKKHIRNKSSRKSQRSNVLGSDIYTQMIKKSFISMKMIINKEDTPPPPPIAAPVRDNKVFESSLVASAVASDIGEAGKKKKSKGKTVQGLQPTQNGKKQKLGKRRSQDGRRKGKKGQLDQNGKDQDDHLEENKSNTASNESGEDNLSDEEAREKKRQERNDQKQQQMDEYQSFQDSGSIELEERKTHFFRTIKSKNWGKLFTNLVVAAIFLAYFIQIYVYNNMFKVKISYFQSSLPLLLNRFRFTMQSQAFSRERIIYNGSLNSFEEIPLYGHNIDSYFNDKSMDNERQITKIKTNYESIIEPLIQILMVTDSQQFCTQIIEKSQSFNSSNSTYQDPKGAGVNQNVSNIYQQQVTNNAVLQDAAIAGNITVLQALKARGVDLNLPNYDKKTALHYAAEFGQASTVSYIVSTGANVNPQDRWGATPLTYAKYSPSISQYLQSVKATQGSDSGNFNLLLSFYSSFTLTQDDYRSFYAAFSNDVQALQSLQTQGKLRIDVIDKDGRSALHIAASQGNLESVQYLVSVGADMYLRDARNSNSIQDAVREQRISVIQYLQSTVDQQVILAYCLDFSQGLLDRGLQQAVGSFQKKFADLQIRVNNTQSYSQKLSYLSPPPLISNVNSSSYFSSQPSSSAQDTSLQVFFSTQELYYHIVIDSMITVIQNTYTSYIDSYASTTQILFLIFLAIQIVILVLLRDRLIETMKEDIFQSRGILNLIPDTFFEQNRDKVEKLIKKLKD